MKSHVVGREKYLSDKTLESNEVVIEVYFKNEKTSIKPLKNKNMVITSKFRFRSRLCIEKVLAPYDIRYNNGYL